MLAQYDVFNGFTWLFNHSQHNNTGFCSACTVSSHDSIIFPLRPSQSIPRFNSSVFICLLLNICFSFHNVNKLFIQDKYIQKISCSASPYSEILNWATELVLFYMKKMLFSIFKNQNQQWWYQLMKSTSFFPKLARLFYPFSDVPSAAWLLQMLLTPQCVSAALVISAQYDLQEAWGKKH